MVVVLVALATARITRLVISDRVTGRPRRAVQDWSEARWEGRQGREPDPNEWQSPVAYLLSCPWCMSVWVGAAVTAATDLVTDVPLPVLTALAASMVTGVILRGGASR